MSPQPFKFDVKTARADGLTEDQILEHLASQKKFDVNKALRDGLSKGQILDHLSGFEPELGKSHNRETMDTLMNFIRPMVAGGASTAAGAFSGPAAPVTAPLAYVATDALMQKLQSKPPTSIASSALNLEPGGVASTLANTGEQFAAGKAFSGVLNAAGRAKKAWFDPEYFGPIGRHSPTTEQLANATGHTALGTFTKHVEDMNIVSKTAALDRAGGKGFTEALRTAKNAGLNFNRDPNVMLDMARNDEPFLQSFAKLNQVIEDPAKLRGVLSAAQQNGVGDNLRKTLGGYKFMDIVDKASTRDLSKNPFSNNVTRLDPEKLSEQWLEPKMQQSLKELYSSKQRGDIEQFFRNVIATQDKMDAAPFAKKFWLMSGGAAMGMGMLTGSLTLAAKGAGAIGLFVSGEGLGRLLTNPKVARTIVAMAGNEPLGVSEQLASKMLSQALNGEMVALINQDGSKTPGIIEDGTFKPVEPPKTRAVGPSLVP